MEHKVVIIGAGHSGGMAAVFLRKKNFLGPITIIGKEKHLPYQRPDLSKRFLSGETIQKSLYIKSDRFFKKNNIILKLNKEVKNIDHANKSILINTGEKISYSTLIIATGSEINQLSIGKNISNLFYLRTIEDSIRLRSALKKNNTLGIIGSGYIGLEIASIASEKKLDVEIFEIEDRALKRVASETMSDFFRRKHESKGVNFKFNTIINNVSQKNNLINILSNDKQSANLDMLVVGIGVRAENKIAKSIGLDFKNGILVDENCRTNIKDIFAIGDCTNHLNKRYKTRMRLESVQNAVEQAETAAAYICNGPKPYNTVPWFWSNQYNIRLQMAGNTEYFDKQVINGSIKNEKFSVNYFLEKKLVAIETVNWPKEFISAKKHIEKGTSFSNTQIKNSAKGITS